MIKSLLKSSVIEYAPETRKIRLRSWVRNLPNSIEVENGKLTVGTIILPPSASIIIQDTVIMNVSDIEIELEVKIDGKIRELSIGKLSHT